MHERSDSSAPHPARVTTSGVETAACATEPPSSAGAAALLPSVVAASAREAPGSMRASRTSRGVPPALSTRTCTASLAPTNSRSEPVRAPRSSREPVSLPVPSCTSTSVHDRHVPPGAGAHLHRHVVEGRVGLPGDAHGGEAVRRHLLRHRDRGEVGLGDPRGRVVVLRLR